MKLTLDIKEPLVSVAWFAENLKASNLVLLHASLNKVTGDTNEKGDIGIENAHVLDIKNEFSDTSNPLPNTMLSPEEFQEQSRLLGINQNSAIVVYDDVGVYSSPRVWWMFKSMGHNNIAVLDGGLPEWIRKGHKTTSLKSNTETKGDFIARYNPDFFVNDNQVLKAITDKNIGITDARSNDRFMGLVEEPREGLRAGHIPNSKNIPYASLQEDGKMLSKEYLRSIFISENKQNEKVIFSCGSGITACILALGAEISGLDNLAVYDGSWTDWGSNHELPIEK